MIKLKLKTGINEGCMNAIVKLVMWCIVKI